MTYNVGDLIELESGKKYFIYDLQKYNNREFSLLINAEDQDDMDIFESVLEGEDVLFNKVEDENLKSEVALLFDKE